MNINNAIDLCRNAVRKLMSGVAKFLNSASGGKLSPNTVTLVGLTMHVPIALLIATGSYTQAAILLVVFGLFDTLDGELARLQKRASAAGMLLDASTDRIKEVILYTGVAYALIAGENPTMAVWAVVACGASICVSYIKAKGETAVKDKGLSSNEINRLFQDGLFRFEIRMLILVLGLVGGQLFYAVVLIALGSSLTAVSRLIKISSKLS